MNTFLDLCQERRSIRAYTAQEVSQQDIDYILECLRTAPSAVNYQPWRVQILHGEDCKRLQQCYTNPWFQTVHTCAVIYLNHEESWHRRLDNKDHGDIDLGIAIAHFLLATAERGLASCCICNFKPDITRKLLAVPDHLEPIAFLPIGYEDKTVESRRPWSRKEIGEITL